MPIWRSLLIDITCGYSIFLEERMSLLQEAVDAVTSTAGWKQASPDAGGVYHFRLQGNLDMDILSPDGRNCILRGDLGSLPEDAIEAEKLLQKCAGRVVGSCRKRRSVLSLQDGRLVLYRIVRMNASDPGTVAREAEGFLNDLAWWRSQVAAVANNASPFSGFGGMNVWMMR